MTRFLTSFEELARAEGQREMVLRQLNRKVGPLSEELEARVTALPSERMLALSEALLDFTRLEDLAGWLAAHTSTPDA